MKKIFLLLLLSMPCALLNAQNAKLRYSVNLNDIADDLFKVTLDVKGLGAENNVYQFASTAPGTYQVMDIGRFVREFKAFDNAGKELEVQKLSTNQYELKNPTKVTRIVYSIAETWDTHVDNDVVYKMCGSSLERDNVLINGQCVFGYLKGMQDDAMQITLQYPTTWLVGTSLPQKKDGSYFASNYDKLVDSPIMLGNLTKASTMLGKAEIDIYTYSKTNLVKSDQLLASMKAMLMAADAFIGGLPVNKYTFLFHFEDESWGAWEHSYGSEYVLKEEPYTPESGKGITSIAAHEFFHVVTPLNIHSEIIEHFNFVTPTPSQHVWLYEGTTEWASNLMRLRSGITDLDTFLKELSQKLNNDSRYDTTYSLVKLALTSYTPEGQKQYGNIYSRGAVVSGLLDIRLLELSQGKRGLREVIQELAKKYGPSKAFSEKDFFKIFTDMTYPEIGDFFEMYVKNANPLPIKEYYDKIGIKYTAKTKTGKLVSNLGAAFDFSSGVIKLKIQRDDFKAFGFEEDDEVVAINGAPVKTDNIRVVAGKLRSEAIGAAYNITVKRNGSEKTVDGTMLSIEEVKRFVFEINPDATPAQKALRDIWLVNRK